MYTMVLTDGTEIEFAGLNGTNLIVPNKQEMDTSIFTDDNLVSCTFIGEDGSEIKLENLSFIQQQKQLDGDYYICFREKSEDEIAQDEIKDLLVQIATIEIYSGNLQLNDVKDSLKYAIETKMDEDKKLEL